MTLERERLLCCGIFAPSNHLYYDPMLFVSRAASAHSCRKKGMSLLTFQFKNVAESKEFKVQPNFHVNIYWIKRGTTEENINGYFITVTGTFLYP
jgi:hypothetical protein